MQGDEKDSGELGALVAALRVKTQEIIVAEHIGHKNRLFSQQAEIYAKLELHPECSVALAQLLDDPDTNIRLDVAQHCKYRKLNLDAALTTLRRLAERSDKIGKEAKSSLEFRLPEPDAAAPPITPRKFPFVPPPPGCDRHEAERMIGAALAPEIAQKIVALLRPAIRIWPKQPVGSPIGSRYGGLPAVPRDFTWPFADEEPFVFLAQINCAELAPLAASFNLPPHGLLSFFGDHDDINGVPASGGAVYYFEDPNELAVRELPLAEDEPLISCDMSFYETYEVPHPFSAVVETLGIANGGNRQVWDSYFDLYATLARSGLDAAQSQDGDDISKLFGWPDLVQGEIYDGKTKLLLQLGTYTDGDDRQWWGPGGLLYFTIEPTALAMREFARAELEVQCT